MCLVLVAIIIKYQQIFFTFTSYSTFFFKMNINYGSFERTWKIGHEHIFSSAATTMHACKNIICKILSWIRGQREPEEVFMFSLWNLLILTTPLL
jgi:hypothetical protein